MMQRFVIAGRQALWILLTASALAAASHALWPDRLQKGAGATDTEAGLGENLVTIEAASEHFRQGTAVFADARSDPYYQAGHIEGALNLDPDLFDIWSETVFSRISADSTIITYCDGERCTLSLELAEKLTWLGYENVFHLKNGWSRWSESGMPVGTGAPSP